MRGTAVYLARVATVMIIAVASLAPSVAINVAHALGDGGQWSLVILAVMGVLAAPICLTSLPHLLKNRRFDLAAGAAMLFAVALIFNLSNAVGLAGGARDHQREGREGQIARVSNASARVQTIESTLAELHTIAKGMTPEMVKGELLKLRADPIFVRSGRCADVTIESSRAHCEKIAEALKQKGAAEQVRQLEAERKDLTGKLAEWGAAPEYADPKVSRIAQIVGLLVPVTTDGSSWVGVVLDVNAAVLAELLGAFLPSIAFALLWPRAVSSVTKPEAAEPVTSEPMSVTDIPMAVAAEKPKTQRKQETAKRADTAIPESVKLFAGRCLVRRAGSTLQAKDVYAAYAADCRDSGMTPENLKQFGLAMAALGYEKQAARVVTYVNVGLKGLRPSLAVVKAG